MRKKGFTLIELLAVIVVLAVIALIAIPIITNIIDKAKLGALKDSAYGIIDAGNMYYANNLKDEIESNLIFNCTENKCINDDKKIEYKGNIENGTLILTPISKTLICVDNGKNYALKQENDKEIKTGTGTCGEYEETNGKFEIYGEIETLNNRIAELEKENNYLKTSGNATEADIKSGKTALVNGKEIIGTYELKNTKTTVLYDGLRKQTLNKTISLNKGEYYILIYNLYAGSSSPYEAANGPTTITSTNKNVVISEIVKYKLYKIVVDEDNTNINLSFNCYADSTGYKENVTIHILQ